MRTHLITITPGELRHSADLIGADTEDTSPFGRELREEAATLRRIADDLERTGRAERDVDYRVIYTTP